MGQEKRPPVLLLITLYSSVIVIIALACQWDGSNDTLSAICQWDGVVDKIRLCFHYAPPVDVC